MNGHWFRFYDSVMDDPKVQRLPPVAFKAWVNLMCMASKNDGRFSTDIKDISFALRVPEGQARDLLQVLQSAGLMERFETGWEPHNWDARQFKSDNSTARVKRFRKRFTKQDETVSETPPEQNRAESEQTPDPADAGGVPTPKPKLQKKTDYPQEFEQFWKAYDPPKNATKPDALKSWQRSADVRPPLPELLVCVAAYRSWIAAESRKRKDPYPIKHPATWLNKRGWESFLASARSAPDPAVQDRADQLMRRGKYADNFKEAAQ